MAIGFMSVYTFARKAIFENLSLVVNIVVNWCNLQSRLANFLAATVFFGLGNPDE